MREMIEKVARAICRPLCKGDFHPCDTDDGQTCKPEACKHWHLYEDSARAAVEAIDQHRKEEVLADLMLFGRHITKGGARVDPRDFYASPEGQKDHTS